MDGDSITGDGELVICEEADPWYHYNFVVKQVQPVEREEFELGKYVPGSKVLIETHTKAVYDGTYVATQQEGARIAVRSVCRWPMQQRGRSHELAYFYCNEIKSLHFLHDEGAEQQNEQFRQFSWANPALKSLSYQQFLHGGKIMWDCEYIPVCDNRCMQALREIQNRDVIGISALGSHVLKVRAAKISFFIVCTAKKIYLFDIKLTAKHFWESGLRQILESKLIQKVCFDSKILSDLLYNRYWKIKIENVFDVQMADYVIGKKIGAPILERDLRSFPQLAEKYLGLPPSIFCDSEWLTSHRLHYRRPADAHLKRNVALCGAFLLPLRNTQRALLLATPSLASQVYADTMASCAPTCRRALDRASLPPAVAACLQEHEDC